MFECFFLIFRQKILQILMKLKIILKELLQVYLKIGNFLINTNICKKIYWSWYVFRQPKKPRISIPKPAKVCRENPVDPMLSEQIAKLSDVQINQIKNIDSSSKSTPSTSSSANKVQDSAIQQPPINSLDVNCKVDSTNIDAEKILNGTLNKYKFLADGQLKINYIGSEEDDSLSNSKM